MLLLTSLVRQLLGLAVMAVMAPLFAVGCLFLPPRVWRIKFCNFFGHTMGRFVVWLCGTRIQGNPVPAMNAAMPAIYVSNHTSPLDIFLGIWLAPYGTCGVAKKEVVWYPFFGQLYLLSGHLRVDRGNHGRALEAMREVAELVRGKGLGIWLWPEGTRSRDGRLLPFKKGFAHLALATGLPVVPVVVSGAHRIWRKNSLFIDPGVVTIKVLPAIDTSAWRSETLDQHIADVRQAINAALPPEQQDSVAVAAK